MKHFFLRVVLTAIIFTNVFEAVAESVTVNLTREGTLAEKVLEQASSLATVTELTVTGKINSADWNCITKQMTSLSTLNMKGATASFETISTINSSLTSLSLPRGVKSFGGGSYSRLGSNLKNCILNEDLENINSNAFEGSAITTIIMPKKLKSIGEEAFSESSLNSIDFSQVEDGNIDLGYGIFSNCRSLTSISLPEGLKSIRGDEIREYRGMFYCCTSLVSVYFPSTMEILDDGVFYGCTGLGTIQLPSSLKKIGQYVFGNCTNLKSITIPLGIREIGSCAFSGCASLQNITLPSSLMKIHSGAFAGCTSLTEISFPESITSIGSGAFSGCSGLTKVTCLIPFPISASSGIFSGINQEACTLVVPEWSALLYKMAVGWSEFSKIETVATGDLALLTVNDNRYLPESVRPNGTPDVYISEEGSLTVRGNKEFNMNELTFNIEIGESKWNWGYGENGDYIEYYTPNLIGSSLFNDESNLTAKSAKLGLKSKGATWGFITLPFDANLSDITPMVEGDVNNYIWKTYDGERRALLGSGGNWKEVSGTLKAGIGYIYQSQNNDSIFVKAIASTLSNMLSKGDITLPLKTYAANDAEDENWNFIGNPYPTYFNTRYIDFTAPITVWNGNGYDAISLTDDDYTLAPCQAFFVQKQKDTENIKFFAEGRTTEYSQSNNNNNYTRAKIYGTTSSERDIINLYLDGANYKDKTRIVFNEKAKLDYELNCDATKFMNEDANIPQLYSIDNGGCQYAINERPEGDGYVTLGILVPETGQYTISVDKINLAKEIYLIDTKENIVTELTSADYTFYSDATTSNGRFILSLEKNATGINNMNVDSSCVNITNKGIIISNALGDRVEVYTLDGKCVYDAVVSNQHETIAMNKGTYVVKVAEKSFKTVIK
ncbi:MAG: leucine-rich repeat domain-containing protein [Alphaproteobacteria bacterium]|nr:leucine-rich repeat domain-containing protein [Alphaproteobacteria bacterium]